MSVSVFFYFQKFWFFVPGDFLPKLGYIIRANWRLKKLLDLAENLFTYSLGEYLGIFFSFFKKSFKVNLISEVNLMFCYQMLQLGLRIIWSFFYSIYCTAFVTDFFLLARCYLYSGTQIQLWITEWSTWKHCSHMDQIA